MNINEVNTNIINGYLDLLENMGSANKVNLIAKLTASLKKESTQKKEKFRKAFGAFVSDNSAEKIIEDIRNSRVSTRKIEAF